MLAATERLTSAAKADEMRNRDNNRAISNRRRMTVSFQSK